MSSYGASTHGANDERFTYLDMEHLLYEEDYIAYKSDFFSVGGMLDQGLEMPTEIKQVINERIMGYGYPFFEETDLIENVNKRFDMYEEDKNIKCFINVGGNDVSFGDSYIIVHAKGGLLTKLSEDDHSTGLVQLYLRKGIPVVHLLDIKELAYKYGMPVDPAIKPLVGEGKLYYEYRYSKWLVGFVLVGVSALFFVMKKKKVF